MGYSWRRTGVLAKLAENKSDWFAGMWRTIVRPVKMQVLSPFANTFDGLFPRWMYEINPEDLKKRLIWRADLYFGTLKTTHCLIVALTMEDLLGKGAFWGLRAERDDIPQFDQLKKKKKI